MTKIGQDISTIDRNMREILKHITNLQKLAPLEPLQESTTTPTSAVNSLQFSFDSVQYTNNCDSSPVTSDSGFTQARKDTILKPVRTEASLRQGESCERLVNTSPPPNQVSCIPELLSRTSEESKTTDNAAIRANKSEDDLLGDSSGIDVHESLVRRHSDGPEKRNRQEQNMIVTKDILPVMTKDKSSVTFKENDLKLTNMINKNIRDICIPVQSDSDSSQYNDLDYLARRHYSKTAFKDFNDFDSSPLHDLATEESRLLNNFTEIHLNGCNAIDSDYRTSTSESYDVSPETPDAATDISESIKTEEEEVLVSYPSSATHTPVTHVHKRFDGVILRTTDL